MGLFETELHRNPAALITNGGPWRGLDDLEIAICAWCRGSTTSGFTGNSTTGRRQKLKPTTVTGLSPTWHEESKPKSLRETQAFTPGLGITASPKFPLPI